MSCNGCRVLRKGCTENCILRQSLQSIQSPQAQANATVFVAKFFGRAGLISFISSVSEPQRPALFQSLLFEACGRTVNPVNGAVGLLWTGNWHVCQTAVETVLRGGTLSQMPEFLVGVPAPGIDGASEVIDVDLFRSQEDLISRSDGGKRKKSEDMTRMLLTDLDLRLRNGFQGRIDRRQENRRLISPSLESEESGTTTLGNDTAYYDQDLQGGKGREEKVLRLFF